MICVFLIYFKKEIVIGYVYLSPAKCLIAPIIIKISQQIKKNGRRMRPIITRISKEEIKIQRIKLRLKLIILYASRRTLAEISFCKARKSAIKIEERRPPEKKFPQRWRTSKILICDLSFSVNGSGGSKVILFSIKFFKKYEILY